MKTKNFSTLILSCFLFSFLFYSGSAFAQEGDVPEVRPSVTINPEAIFNRFSFFNSRLKKIVLEAEKNIKKIDRQMGKEGLTVGDKGKERMAAEYLQMGDVSYKEGKFYDAITQWQQAYALTQRRQLRHSLKKAIDKAKAELVREKQVEQAILPKPEAQDAISDMEKYICEGGVAFYKRGEYNQALTEFNKALLINPNSRIAKKYIQVIFSKGRNEPQIQDLPTEVERGEGTSKSEQYFCSMGIVMYNKGDYKEAEAEFKKVLLISPGNRTAQAYLNSISSGAPPKSVQGQNQIGKKKNFFEKTGDFFRSLFK